MKYNLYKVPPFFHKSLFILIFINTIVYGNQVKLFIRLKDPEFRSYDNKLLNALWDIASLTIALFK